MKASFSAEKTSALLLLMRKVKKHVVQLGDNDGIESVLLVLKVELLEYCSNREATVEVRPPEPTSEELAEQNKNRRKTPKGRKKVDETQVEEPSIEYETVILPPVLTAEDAKDISKFALHTLVQHWELYRYVFNQHQARNLSKYVEFLEQPMAPLPLATAIDDTEWNQRKAQERVCGIVCETPCFARESFTFHSLARWRENRKRSENKKKWSGGGGQKRKKREYDYKRRKRNATLQNCRERIFTRSPSISSSTSHRTCRKRNQKWWRRSQSFRES